MKPYSPAPASGVRRDRGFAVSPLDAGIVLLLLAGGLVFHRDATYWGIAFVGESQYGDAEFWWNSALHLSRGILADNPGRGFRPGYIILTGLALPVLGTQFLVFHKFLALIFLTVAGVFYLSVRDLMGRLVSFCTVGVLVFNPYTAEWIATSTTDGTGLVLHLLAFTCLLRGFHDRRPLVWLAGFGLFFSLATLTRPIVTPFIAVALVVLLVSLPRGWKANAIAAGAALAAFLAPLIAWVAIQRMTIGDWSVSTNEASAFYAASHPGIQVWNNEMYRTVEASARARLEVDSVSQAQLNREFWRLTVRNYRVHWRYHLRRLPPHLWEISRFGPHMSRRGHELYRTGFLVLFLLGSLIALALSRDWPRAVLAALFLIISVGWPSTAASLFVLGGVVVALTVHLRRPAGGAPGGAPLLLVAAYWLVGVAALALVGGTWSPGGSGPVHINALGYRVGSQLFFAGDLLAFAFLGTTLNPLPAFGRGALRSLLIPRHGLTRLTTAAFLLCWTTVALILAVGAGIVAARWWALERVVKQPYPPVDGIVASLGEAATAKGLTDLLLELGSGAGRPSASPSVVTTGAGTEFLWNLEGQERAQLLVYLQTSVRPFFMHPNRLIVEFPGHQEGRHWTHRQGVFVLKRIPDRPNTSNLPYFISETAVRGFIPLSPDGTDYDLSRARWFPLAVYASQLEANQLLTVERGTIEWRVDSGSLEFKRRLRLKTSAPSGDPVISISLKRFRGLRSLRLDWPAPAASRSPRQPPTTLRIVVAPARADPWAEEFSPGRPVRLAFRQPQLDGVRLEFSGVPSEGLWLYELNLVADDLDAG